MYNVYISGRLVKEYPFHIQAIIYLMLKGYCYRSRCGMFLDNRVKIVKVRKLKK